MNPEIANSSQTAPSPTQVAEQLKKRKHTPIIVVLVILIVVGLGFGGFELWQNIQKDSQISDLKIQLNSKVNESNIPDQNEDNSGINNENMFIVNQMGIGIKNLDDAGTISQYKYTMDRSAIAGGRPISSIEILSFSGVPEIGTDYITGISGAIIYEYDEESSFDTSKCTVQIGKINKHNLCVTRRSINEEFKQLDDEIFTAWNTWAELNIDKLMNVLSNPENYAKI